MTWNRAYWNRMPPPTAEIIPFPSDKAKQCKPIALEAGAYGRVLLYTGVRYERVEPVWRDDTHRPRRGGRRS